MQSKISRIISCPNKEDFNKLSPSAGVEYILALIKYFLFNTLTNMPPAELLSARTFSDIIIRVYNYVDSAFVANKEFRRKLNLGVDGLTPKEKEILNVALFKYRDWINLYPQLLTILSQLNINFCRSSTKTEEVVEDEMLTTIVLYILMVNHKDTCTYYKGAQFYLDKEVTNIADIFKWLGKLMDKIAILSLSPEWGYEQQLSYYLERINWEGATFPAGVHIPLRWDRLYSPPECLAILWGDDNGSQYLQCYSDNPETPKEVSFIGLLGKLKSIWVKRLSDNIDSKDYILRLANSAINTKSGYTVLEAWVKKEQFELFIDKMQALFSVVEKEIIQKHSYIKAVLKISNWDKQQSLPSKFIVEDISKQFNCQILDSRIKVFTYKEYLCYCCSAQDYKICSPDTKEQPAHPLTTETSIRYSVIKDGKAYSSLIKPFLLEADNQTNVAGYVWLPKESIETMQENTEENSISLTNKKALKKALYHCLEKKEDYDE